MLVDGQEYRSVADAFQQLKLPLNKHIKFRMELKAAGHAKFEHHSFSIVKKAE